MIADFINGLPTPSGSERCIEVANPANGRPLVSLPVGDEGDVNRAVASARAAFAEGRWCEAPPSSKKGVLHRFADLIAADTLALDRLDAEEMGKPVSVKFGNAAAAASLVRFHAEAVDKFAGDVFTSDQSTMVAQRRVPRGVVAAIVPWNFPTVNAAIKIAPALVAGNSLVLKPSEIASRSALRLAELAVQAGLPPGVLNVVPGVGDTVGKALALHQDVDMLAFTGSTMVGKLMQQYAGQSNLKVVLAECGGKSPQIVFEDFEDLDAVADGVAYMILTNQGQWCAAGSRLLVQESIEVLLLGKLVERFKQIVVGEPLDPKVTFGPLATAQHCAKVGRYVDLGRKDGAECVIGGERLLAETGGNFIAPTLFRGVRPDMRMAQEEIFGPVLSVMTFKDEAEAIRLANSTIYGLVATVWTSQLGRGMRLSRAIRAGLVTVNSARPVGEGSPAFSVEPYGQSGLGTELGLAGIESYCRRQVTWFNH